MDSLPPSAPPADADPHAVTDLARLKALYDPPRQVVLDKVTDRLGPATLGFLRAAPFCLLATAGTRGVRCTPRGDAPGFVEALDDRTLALPDRRGNNRIEALRDILENPEVALLFLVPGSSETLRVNGAARITADPALRARYAVDGKLPATVVLVAVREVYMQCAKALMRSRLWDGRARPEGLPSMGALLAEHTKGAVEPVSFDAEAPARLRATMYWGRSAKTASRGRRAPVRPSAAPARQRLPACQPRNPAAPPAAAGPAPAGARPPAPATPVPRAPRRRGDSLRSSARPRPPQGQRSPRRNAARSSPPSCLSLDRFRRATATGDCVAAIVHQPAVPRERNCARPHGYAIRNRPGSPPRRGRWGCRSRATRIEPPPA